MYTDEQQVNIINNAVFRLDFIRVNPFASVAGRF